MLITLFSDGGINSIHLYGVKNLWVLLFALVQMCSVYLCLLHTNKIVDRRLFSRQWLSFAFSNAVCESIQQNATSFKLVLLQGKTQQSIKRVSTESEQSLNSVSTESQESLNRVSRALLLALIDYIKTCVSFDPSLFWTTTSRS